MCTFSKDFKALVDADTQTNTKAITVFNCALKQNDLAGMSHRLPLCYNLFHSKSPIEWI